MKLTHDECGGEIILHTSGEGVDNLFACQRCGAHFVEEDGFFLELADDNAVPEGDEDDGSI